MDKSIVNAVKYCEKCKSNNTNIIRVTTKDLHSSENAQKHVNIWILSVDLEPCNSFALIKQRKRSLCRFTSTDIIKETSSTIFFSYYNVEILLVMISEKASFFALYLFWKIGFNFVAIWDKLSMGITVIENVHIFPLWKFICDVFPLQTLNR